MKLARASLALVLAVCLLGCPAEPEQAAPSPPPPPAAEPLPVPDPPAVPPPPAGRAAEPGLAAALEGRKAVPDRALEEWLAAFTAAGDGGFVPERAAEDELFLYATESMAATGFCLRDAVDPHRGARGKVRWEVRPARAGAPDVLRARWEAAGLSLTLTEGLNALFVQAEPLAGPRAPLTPKRLRALTQAVVRTRCVDHTWTWDVPEGVDLTRGTHLFSSRGAPERLVRMQTRDDRADILVVRGRVIFVFYKKIAQRLGFEDGETWFRDSTREAFSG